MPRETLPTVAITMGDPAGIGPELCLKALAEPRVLHSCVPVVFGDSRILDRVARRCGVALSLPVVPAADWRTSPSAREPLIVDCDAVDADDVEPGAISADCGRAAYTYIVDSIRAAVAEEVAAVVTAPIHKKALRLAGVPHPGHTEIFAALTDTQRYCMMLTSDEITVSFVTTHVSYADVPAALSVERIVEVIDLTAGAVGLLRGRAARLLVCGLNPHAGEHGVFGREEEKLIAPAVSAACEKGIHAEGPVSPDAAFVPESRRRVDAFVCMYHDQGHIPFKMLAFDTGVNVTLGLPVIRTSVDHGTAFDIAWRGSASPESLVRAVLLAVRLAAQKDYGT